MKEHEVNKLNCGIGAWYIDPSICDELVDFFESNKQGHIQGICGGGAPENSSVIPETKDSTDLACGEYGRIFPFSTYLDQLAQACNHYQDKYEFSSDMHGLWKIVEGYNIQRYHPGQGFHGWHFERNGLDNSKRHLAWMTYLNDVTEGGETEWFHQNVKIKPEKGLTVLWPSDWWFTHRGVTSHTQTKYIITGWYSYY